MNSKFYRCGWCGCPTEETGKNFTEKKHKQAIRIIETYGDGIHTNLINGYCCPNGNY